MRRTIVLVTLVGAVLLACSGVVLAQQGLSEPELTTEGVFVPGEAANAFVPGEILVGFKGSTSKAEKEKAHKDKGRGGGHYRRHQRRCG